jgi:hypothetical protein
LISPPQEQKNFWVELVVREFLLAWAICISPYGKSVLEKTPLVNPPEPLRRKVFQERNSVFFYSNIVLLLEKM